MIYMLEINMLVATIVFGLAAMSILALFVSLEAKKYAHVVLGRVVATMHRESIAISRVDSRNHTSVPAR